MRMTDILIREVDDAIAERLRQIAVERNWPVNQVILHALRVALGLGGEDLVKRDRQDIAHLRGTWNPGETAAFREALSAFEHVDGKPLFSEGAAKPRVTLLASACSMYPRAAVSASNPAAPASPANAKIGCSTVSAARLRTIGRCFRSKVCIANGFRPLWSVLVFLVAMVYAPVASHHKSEAG